MWWFVAFACKSEAPEPLPDPEPTPEVAPEPPPPPPIVWEDRYAGSWVVVAYAGSRDAPAAVSRTREDAKARAEALRARVVGGEPLADVARAESDAPDRGRGGDVGTWRTGWLDPAFEEAVARTPIGGVSEVVETPWGFAFAARRAVIEAEAAQIVVAWQGAEPRQSLRTKEEAKARAEAVLARLQAGEDFAAVAREVSDDVSAPDGGALGVVAPGQLVPPVDRALFGLGDGETSGLVETPFGYVIVRRLTR